ncbi:hypothetical protein CCMSSC00406_0009517 [Pleurotus cornucopiae]|uniref:Uncharacterized protein n=1 Tax=Pleurotus cornucopiae TaxID=5321 RepID=A0ACB7IP08_PLECO|nr:hypothetical protein CCMSSC00406_0009517 [Pleurotus cornucopiae]
MASRAQSPDSSKPKIVALPSLASSLSSLPQAKSMAHVALHPNMYAQRAAESEAKLQRALTKNASSHASQNPPSPAYNLPPQPESPNNPNSPLMMRKPQRPKFST